VAGAQQRDGEEPETEPPVEQELHLLIGEMATQRRPNGVIGKGDAKVCHYKEGDPESEPTVAGFPER
jgi:hypothetical protein